MTNQPKWHCVANLGDVNPLEYGGAFVLIDATGVYPPELHVWDEPTGEPAKEVEYLGWEDQCTTEEGEKPEELLTWITGTIDSTQKWTRHVVILDRCTYQNQILSDNKYHPNQPAWWFNEGSLDKAPMADLARFNGTDPQQLIYRFCSIDPIERAQAYLMVMQYYGPQEEPTTFDDEDTVRRIMNQYLAQIQE